MKYEITAKELAFVLFIAVMGFAFSSREWLLFLAGLSPIQGLIVYYIILYVMIFLLAKLGLVIYKFRIENPTQVFGALLITFAFFIIVDWESQYVYYVQKGVMGESNLVFYQAEDGATWYFWYEVMNIKNIEVARFLTYVLTPAVLSLVGVFLVTRVSLL